mmetsp:Transcript_3257/g.10151  ORF Transcript_3257/g.10151 Transcript_3257/m.10151 type:complete len:307 (-) Transcript_3257:137-1057(-)
MKPGYLKPSISKTDCCSAAKPSEQVSAPAASIRNCFWRSAGRFMPKITGRSATASSRLFLAASAASWVALAAFLTSSMSSLSLFSPSSPGGLTSMARTLTPLPPGPGEGRSTGLVKSTGSDRKPATKMAVASTCSARIGAMSASVQFWPVASRSTPMTYVPSREPMAAAVLVMPSSTEAYLGDMSWCVQKRPTRLHAPSANAADSSVTTPATTYPGAAPQPAGTRRSRPPIRNRHVPGPRNATDCARWRTCVSVYLPLARSPSAACPTNSVIATVDAYGRMLRRDDLAMLRPRAPSRNEGSHARKP